MRWLTRLWRHRWLDAGDALRLLGADGIERLQARIRASEAQHSGEIRVCVEAGLPLSYLWRDASPRERAVALFGKLRVWDTEANNGVLIYLLLADHAIEIVADRGVDRRVPPGHWQRVVEAMGEAFRAGRFEDGLAQAIDAVHEVLLAHYALPAGERNVNELPDTVVIL
ncbi:TPM domain-containing protein [Azohydromonas sediminis]|uniref:TPM domain-containing protein n=1 Tax=Azohydromonas sediminis TaxID=2259674 RepID=UPI000E65EA6C|nr:TPM domain-containing protein [Azohydromonas sediminis]